MGALALTVAAAPAAAATRSSVSVTGPSTVHTGDQVRLHFSGYAAAGVAKLRVWLDNTTCATRAKAEGTRRGLKPPIDFTVHRHFKARLTVQRSSKGTHVVCAYLVSLKTTDTTARGSWRYVTS